jgi:MFS family permease
VWLLVAMAFAGVANGVYHPADYALLAQGVEESRVGRAFSIHTFAGFLGGAIAPGLLLGVAALAGTAGAFATAGVVGLLAVAVMMLPSRVAAAVRPLGAASSGKGKARPPGKTGVAVRVFTPTVLVLTLLFTLLSLSTGSVQNFSVAALVTGYGIELPLANLALTAFLFASALGVLAGGVVADRTQRHGAVAASAFAATALLIGFVALADPPAALLVPVMGVAGFLSGLITPSRDMLVRAAAPAGAEGRVFGIVSTGFNIGGAAGPVLFGWLIDSGHPRGIFWSAVVFMLLTVALTLLQEWHRARKLRRTVAMAG